MRRLVSAAAILIATVAVVVLGSSAAHAASAPKVPLGVFTDLVVDRSHSHLFVSGVALPGQSASHGGVYVTALDGTSRTRLAGIGNTDQIVLSPDGSSLYALVENGDVAVVSTTTLTVTKTYQAGITNCPVDPSIAAGKLWFGYGCEAAYDEGLGSLDLTSGAVTTGMFNGASNYYPHLTSIPGMPDTLVMSDVDQDGLLALLDVSTGSPVIGDSVAAGNVQDLVARPDGSAVIATDFTHTAREFSTVDLSDTGLAYATPQDYSDHAAISPDEKYVGIATDFIDNSISTFGPSSDSPVRTYDLGAFNGSASYVYVPSAIGWIDNDTIVGVITDSGREQPEIRLFQHPELGDSSLTLSGPRRVDRTASATFQGRLKGLAGPLGSVQLAVRKTDLDGTHVLHSVTTGADGRYQFTDRPTVGGAVVYTVIYAGSTDHRAAQRSFSVTVSRATPALSVKVSKPVYDYGQQQKVTVHLGRTHSVRSVAIYAKPRGGTAHLVRSGRVSRAGTFTATMSLTRNFTVIAKFAGDEWYAPRSVTSSGKVRVRIQEAIAGAYSTHDGYHWLHQSKGGALAVKVSPNKYNDPVIFRLQALESGVWRTVDRATQYLNQNSVIGVAFDGRTYTPLRIRGEYRADGENAGQVGKWWYVQFT